MGGQGVRGFLIGVVIAALLIGGCAGNNQQRLQAGNAQPSVSALTEALSQLWNAPASNRAKQAEEIYKMAQQLGTPVVDGESMLFFYKGPAKQVTVEGAFMPPLTMERVEGTDLLMAQTEVADLDHGTIGYMLQVDGKLTKDPLTRAEQDRTLPAEAIYRGDEVEATPELYPQPGVPKGKTEQFDLVSSSLQATRKISVYLPPGYDAKQVYPVVYVPDEQIAVGRMQTPVILDNMIAGKQIPSLIAVFVEANYDLRRDEYLPDGSRWAGYQNFFLNELMPEVHRRYSVSTDREDTLLMGASNGGGFAVYMPLAHPDKFGGGIALSAAITADYPIPPISKAQPLKFYLTVGTLESILLHTHSYLKDGLATAGAEVETDERPGGHDAPFWSEELVPALEWMFADS